MQKLTRHAGVVVRIGLALFLLASISCRHQNGNPVSSQDMDLISKIGFDKKVMEIARKYGDGFDQLKALDEGGEMLPVNGLLLNVPSGDSAGPLANLRKELQPLGYLAFLYEMNYGTKPDKLAIIKGTDQFEILNLQQTNGIKYNITHEQVVSRLREWDSRFGIRITGAGEDWVEAEFVNPPPDMAAFAREVYEFCPDSVDQGAGSVGDLEQELRRDNRVFLWWD